MVIDPPAEKVSDPWVINVPERATATLFVTRCVLWMVMLVPGPPAGGTLAVTQLEPFHVCHVFVLLHGPVWALR